MRFKPFVACAAGIFAASLLTFLDPCAVAQDIPRPVIPATVLNVTNYGALGDGTTTNTAAIQHAIDAASTAGGGTVLIPDGRFLTGPFTLASHINLHLADGARHSHH